LSFEMLNFYAFWTLYGAALTGGSNCNNDVCIFIFSQPYQQSRYCRLSVRNVLWLNGAS